MRKNGIKTNFSNEASEQIALIKKHLGYIEARVENNDINDDTDREIFIRFCDLLGACLEHLKSEVINNDKRG